MVDTKEYALLSGNFVNAVGLCKVHQLICLTANHTYKRILQDTYPDAPKEVLEAVARGEYRVEGDNVIVSISTT